MTGPQPGRLRIESIEDLMRLAEIMFKGGGAAMPNVDRPEKMFVVLLHGLEVGLTPAQARANIMMQPNGRCSIYGDAALALVRSKNVMESFEETTAGEGDARIATCRSKRAGESKERVCTFSITDAKRAGLIEKAKGKDGKGQGNWITFPDRMLMFRARGFLLRDLYGDVLLGLITTEEAQDMLDVEMGAPRVVQATAAAGPAALPEHTPTVAYDERTPTAPALPGRPVDAPPVEDTTPAPDGPPDADQMARLAWVRKQLAVSKTLTDPAEIAAAWKELLGTYGVASAKEFTHAAAAKFLAAEEPKHDPFTHPPESRQAA